MPGAAPQVIVAGFDASTKGGGYLNITYNYTDKISLNDANTSYASSYSLLGARLGYKNIFHRKIKGEIFAGADNIFNTKYSLGNDINAAAGRYYNAAPGRNFYAGIIFKFGRS
jgi:iron complex outermembrane receptor protein